MPRYIDIEPYETSGETKLKWEVWDKERKTVDVHMKWTHEIPSVDMRPVVRGRWKDTGSLWKCPCCNSAYKKRLLYIEPNYCPNCGADMRGGDAE